MELIEAKLYSLTTLASTDGVAVKSARYLDRKPLPA
jgi:hypothetical protein